MFELVPQTRGDNFSYLVYDQPGGDALLVDPVATGPLQEALKSHDLTTRYVVNTHGHGDHTSGNRAFVGSGVELLAHRQAASKISDVDRRLEHGDTVSVGSLELTVLHTPGHTDGSICLVGNEALYSGDTVFLAGCGNPKFGGDTRKLFESLRDHIVDLPGDLQLCPGHDYAHRNLSFVLNVDPDNHAAEAKLDEVRSGSGPTTSTLAEEHEYNPFFRFDEPAVKQALNLPDADGWTVFRELRQRRNDW